MAMAEMPGPYDVRAYACRVARRRHQHLPDGALSRRVAPGDHLRARTADGQGGGRVRHRSGRNPPPQPDRHVSPTRRRRASCSTRRAISRRWKWRSTAIDLPAFRARQKAARAARPLSRHRLCDLLRAHRLRQPGVRRARHGDHAGLGNGRSRPWIRPASSRRGSARRRTARGCARRSRRSSPTRSASTPQADQGRAWRHRPHALWLGHLRQPLAGDLRRRLPDRGAEDARASSSSSRAICWRRRPTTSCSKTARPRSPAPTAPSRSRRWRARPIIRPIASRARSSRD